MCGILAFAGANTPPNVDLIERVMLQLSMRGTHATGYSWRESDGHIEVCKQPISAAQFISAFPLTALLSCSGLHLPEIRLIGHTRYSTSDLAYNQPLQMGNTAIVMNGVLSQEGPETWPKSKWPYTTRNDTEIALHYALMGKRGDFHGSYAIAELDENVLLCYRNGYRPLWFGKGDDYMICASTRDALERCGVPFFRPLAAGNMIDLIHVGLRYTIQGTFKDDYQRGLVAAYGSLKSKI